ncbi:MAG: hypothetical protein ACD_25C00265G0001, partial [uncultured bacterium]
MKIYKLLLLTLVWSLAVCLLSIVNRIYSADRISVQATEFLKEEEPGRALTLVNKSILLNPYEPSYY